MALMRIILEGDPRLRQRAAKIRTVDDRLRQIAADMRETMEDAPGVGLAGPQVGVMERIIVVHVPGDYIAEDDDDEEVEDDVRFTLINPEIVRGDGEDTATEGCLSIPGWIGDVPRYTALTIKAIDLDGRPVRIKAYDWVARVLQHEIDHLDGILFLDRIVDKSTIRPINVDRDESEIVALAGDAPVNQ